jgi:hypothetical protein
MSDRGFLLYLNDIQDSGQAIHQDLPPLLVATNNMLRSLNGN